MASPPIGAYDVRIDPSANVRRITPQMPVSPVGGALENFANAAQFKAQQDGVVQASKLMADTRAKWTQHLIDSQNAYQLGDDFAGTIAKDYKDYHDKALKQLNNPFAKKFADEQLRSFGTDVTDNALKFQAQAQVAGRITTMQDAISSSAISVKADPSQFEQVYGEQLSAINALQVDPITRSKLATTLRDELSISAAKTLGERDPYGTMVALAKPQSGSPAIDRLSIKGREEVQDHILSVQRMIQAQDDHAFAVQERNQREASGNLLKEGIKLQQDGKLTPAWIEKYHNVWEPEAYRYMYNLAAGRAGEEAKTDPKVFAPLLEQALQGKDITDDAHAALIAGSLSTTDYTKLVEKSSQPRMSWVERGTKFIATSAAVSDLNPDPAAAQRKARMLSDWDQWVDENPKASASQARDQAESIVNEYAIVDAHNSIITKRAPKFLVGSRMNPDIDKTEAETVKAFNEGRIDRAEFDRQAQLLSDWRTAIEKIPKPKKAEK